jgi:DNA modification methylase
MANSLYYGDNLVTLRNRIKDESIDLCYIDPPFNSKRNYNQIYNNVGADDRAQAQAFVDTWTWDDEAREGYQEIISNEKGRYCPSTIELIKGLANVLKESSLLAYLVSMTRRIVEIHRVLKPTGSFYLHCDPTSSHYLKIVLDSIFSPTQFRNEVVWDYSFRLMDLPNFFNRKHDILLFYAKSKNAVFHMPKTVWTREDIVRSRKQEIHTDEHGEEWIWMPGGKGHSKNKLKKLSDIITQGKAISDVWQIPTLSSSSKERLGYPTQKPETLLERVIRASTNEGEVVLDAYCGCGTTVAVAQRLKRKWVGMDITFQSISLILRRLEQAFGHEIVESVNLDGAPRDMAAAHALAHKKDDRLRKEFEKWAILTYTGNRASINDKKGADAGIDGIAYFLTNKTESDRMVFQVKSGTVGRGDIAKFKGDMARERAPLGTFITLEPPTHPMREEAKRAGLYRNQFMSKNYDRVQIVTVKEIVEQGKRLGMPLKCEVLQNVRGTAGEQLDLAA